MTYFFYFSWIFLISLFLLLTTDPDLLACCFRCIGVQLKQVRGYCFKDQLTRTPVSSRFVVTFYIFTGIIIFFFAAHVWALLYAFDSSLGPDHRHRAFAGREGSWRGFEWLHWALPHGDRFYMITFNYFLILSLYLFGFYYVHIRTQKNIKKHSKKNTKT